MALGIDSGGVKHPLGLWDGLTESARRHDPAGQPRRAGPGCEGVLCVINGAKALRKAIRNLGIYSPFQRWCATRRETCSSTCPSATIPQIKRRLRAA